ncbi:hypothetical protein [Flaviaesturariibacter amylovorans]|uniref:Uncharacterized protein n=1 Tax=Flaviaesturariibacter amylovorans TaxID=1084520 RepID=A0ABP8GQF5_9BACT
MKRLFEVDGHEATLGEIISANYDGMDKEDLARLADAIDELEVGQVLREWSIPITRVK